MKTCKQESCWAEIPDTRGRRGRPQIWCPEHGSTKHASRRSRQAPKPAKPSCCPARGYCEQHRWWAKELRWRLEKQGNETKANRAVLDELVDVWGVASIWSEDLYKPVASWEKFEGSSAW